MTTLAEASPDIASVRARCLLDEDSSRQLCGRCQEPCPRSRVGEYRRSQAQELSGGGYRLQFFSPANNPGYGKLYVQEIDSAGNVISEFKNTMGPDGLIETKWVHGGP